MAKNQIPAIQLEDIELQRILDALTERVNELSGFSGSQGDAALTVDQYLGGAVAGPSGTLVSPRPGGLTPPDLPPVNAYPDPGPPEDAPYNLLAVPITDQIKLSWGANFTNVAYFEVWRATLDDRNQAVLHAQIVSNFFVDPIGFSETYYYWVRAIGTDGTPSEFNSVAGTAGTTTASVQQIIDELAGRLDDSEFVTALRDRLDAIDTDPDSILDRLGIVETDLNTAETDIDDAESTISDHTVTLANHVSRIQTLESSSGSYDAVEEWLFTSSIDGWANYQDGTVTHDSTNGYMVVTPSVVGNAAITSPAALSPVVDGSLYRAVRARVRLQTLGGATNDGWVGYMGYSIDGGHGYDAGYRAQKTNEDIWGSGDNFANHVGEWVIIEWDMSDLDTGGDDWINNDIDDIYLVSGIRQGDGDPVWEIDWVQISTFSTQALASAIDVLDTQINGASGLASDITALETTLDSPTTGGTALASAFDSLQTQVDATDGTLTAAVTDITQLQVQGTVTTRIPSIINPLNDTGLSQNTGWSSHSGATLQSVALRTTDGEQRISGGWTTADGDTSAGMWTEYFDIRSTDIIALDFKFASAVTQGRLLVEVQFSDEATGTIHTGHRINVSTSSTAANSGEIGNTGQNQIDVCDVDFALLADSGFNRLRTNILGSDVSPNSCPQGFYNDTAFEDGRGGVVSGLNNNCRDGAQCASGIADRFRIRFRHYDAVSAGTKDVAITDVYLQRTDPVSQQVTAILKQESDIRITETGELKAQYTVKIDSGTGRVVGYGLASEPTDGGGNESTFAVQADRFAVVDNSGSTPRYPFVVDGPSGVVAIDGDLFVDGSINGDKIEAGSIASDRVDATFISAVAAEIGDLTVTELSTSSDEDDWRLEISQTHPAYPVWYGTGAIGFGNGRFTLDKSGNVNVQGIISSSRIQTSTFRPNTADSTFRIECIDTDGTTTGKVARFSALETSQYEGDAMIGIHPDEDNGAIWYDTDAAITIYSPTYNASPEPNIEYMRCGTWAEVFHANIDFILYSKPKFGDNHYGGRPNIGYAYRYYSEAGVAESIRYLDYWSPLLNPAPSRNLFGTGYGWAGFNSVSTTVTGFTLPTSWDGITRPMRRETFCTRDPSNSGVDRWSKLEIFPCARILSEATDILGNPSGYLNEVGDSVGESSRASVYYAAMQVTLPNFGYGDYLQRQGSSSGGFIASSNYAGSYVNTGRHGRPLL